MRAPTPKAAPIPELFSIKGTVKPAIKAEIFDKAYKHPNAIAIS